MLHRLKIENFASIRDRQVIDYRRIHIDAVVLQPGGGDPLALVELAGRQALRRANLGEDHAFKAVLLDGDTTGRNPERDGKIAGTAERTSLLLIWQIPCHEALILRHLDGCAALRPASSGRALEESQRRWPEYRKGLPADRLGARLDEKAVLRVAEEEAALASLLAALEFGRD